MDYQPQLRVTILKLFSTKYPLSGLTDCGYVWILVHLDHEKWLNLYQLSKLIWQMQGNTTFLNVIYAPFGLID